MPKVPSDPAVPLELATFEPEFSRNPYPLYAELRQTTPVRAAVVYGVPVWLVTRYAEAREALADTRLKHDRRHATDEIRAAGPWMFLTEQLGFDRYMLASDGRDHSRLRRMVNKVFTARRVEALRPWISELATETVNRFLPRGKVDIVEELAYPVPIMVISQLLGVPMEDRADVRRWAEAFSSAGAADPESMLSGFLNMKAYFEDLAARLTRQIDQGEITDVDVDLLTALVAVRDEGERLDANELVAMCFQMLVAGFETSANMIANGVLALTQNPDQQAELRAHPELLPGAVEEVIRYDAPVKQPWFRYTIEDVPIGDVVVPAGSVVVVNVASANRDPERYADPDRFDVHRDASGQLGFSHGPHFCLGAPLARVEGEIIFGALLDRCRDLTLAVDPAELTYRPSPSMRILERLPVTFTPVDAMVAMSMTSTVRHDDHPGAGPLPDVDDIRAEREQIATRLLTASVRRSYDSDVDLDWDAPMPIDMYHWPPERISIYGTPMWESLTPQQKIDLSQQEVACMASVGIWFEIIALQLLARYVYPLDPKQKHVQYALTEMADECRHIVMFARSVERGGAPVYRPGRLASFMGTMMGHTAFGPSLLAVILTAEDITDTFQREAMADERLQPMVRGVSRIHVVEEARHLQYARAEVQRMWANTNALERVIHRMVIAVSAFFVARSLISPKVYDKVGLPRRAARRAALRNPYYRQTLRWSGERVTTFLRENGMIDRLSAFVWRRAGLI